MVRKNEKVVKRRNNFKFSDKNHPKLGIISVALGVISLAILILSSYVSSKSHGNGTIYLGLAGIFALIVSIIGMVLAIKSVEEKEIFYRIPILGIILNGCLIIGYVILYFIGLI